MLGILFGIFAGLIGTGLSRMELSSTGREAPDLFI